MSKPVKSAVRSLMARRSVSAADEDAEVFALLRLVLAAEDEVDATPALVVPRSLAFSAARAFDCCVSKASSCFNALTVR